VEEEVSSSSIAFIIPEQKYGVVVSCGAYGSKIKYRVGSEEYVDFFDNEDFIISDEVSFINSKEGN
jgi:hypothetical protein